MESRRLYRAEGLMPLIAIDGDGLVEATLDDVMAGWALTEVGGEGEPDLTVTQSAKGWICDGLTYDEPAAYRDSVAASCSLIAHLFKAHTLADGDGLCLHAAAVETGGGVVLLTGPYRTGKSVVSAASAATGLRVFSDDIVPLSPDGRNALAPGLAIRLRRPLPGSLTSRTRTFLERYRIAESERYLYVRPPAGRLARRGAAAPVRAIVILDRREDGPAEVEALPPSHGLREAIRRNFARETSAGRIVETFDGLIREVPCLRLRYAIAEDAAALLARGLDKPIADAEPTGPPLGGADTRPKRLLDPGTLIWRADGVRVNERAGELFLTDRDDRTIFNLNQTGSAVWTAAEEPIAFGDLAALFAAAFPERDEAAIASDLSTLIRRMARHGLVVLEDGLRETG